MRDFQPRCGSLLGGTEVIITGSGFCGDVNETTVNMGDVQCDIEEVTPTRITCVTAGPNKVISVDNNGRHPEFGLGYAWNLTDIHITVGDTVKVKSNVISFL